MQKCLQSIPSDKIPIRLLASVSSDIILLTLKWGCVLGIKQLFQDVVVWQVIPRCLWILFMGVFISVSPRNGDLVWGFCATNGWTNMHQIISSGYPWSQARKRLVCISLSSALLWYFRIVCSCVVCKKLWFFRCMITWQARGGRICDQEIGSCESAPTALP